MALLPKTPQSHQPAGPIQIILSRSIQARHFGSELIEHCDEGTRMEVTPQDARDIVVYGEGGWFVHAADDPSADKRWTLNSARQAALDCAARLRAEERARREQVEAARRLSAAAAPQ